jgi:hypothetical protein
MGLILVFVFELLFLGVLAVKFSSLIFLWIATFCYSPFHNEVALM